MSSIVTDSLNPYLDLASDYQASDLHLIQGISPTLRVNGEIILADMGPMQKNVLKSIFDELLSPEQVEQFKSNWELCISFQHEVAGRLRITIYQRAGVPEFSVRFCGERIATREELGLPKKIDELAMKPHGLVIITGPTGAGKTTTLNYMVDLINRERRCKIVTIEDPIEFVHENQKAIVVQQEVVTDVKSFKSALVHVLRQDPDVIIVGEMRDHETIATALNAAETGHLVLATLHSPNVANAFERMLGVFEGNAQRQIIIQLSNTIQGILAQDLLPGTDRSGRVLGYEMVIGTGAVRRLIRDNQLHQLENVIQTGRKEGMELMDNCLFELYSKCLISYDTALSRARDPQKIKKRTD